MIVEQIWTGNAYRNFNYLIACPDSGEALAVDPLDHQQVPRPREGEGLEHHADSSTRTNTATTPAATAR